MIIDRTQGGGGEVERYYHNALIPSILSLTIHHVTCYFDMDALGIV